MRKQKTINEAYWEKPCKDCGGKKEYGYRNSCRCSACTELIRKSKRSYEKKSPHGTGRKPTCSKCGLLKEEGRENESCCKKCKSEHRKALRAKKRIEIGLRPFGSGRKETCCRCGDKKEKIEYGYCAKCDAYMKKNRRDKKVSTETGKLQERKSYAKKALNAEFRKKRIAHSYVAKALKDGILIKMACFVCGEMNTDAHHDDYMKPLDVRWLCRKHHAEHHKNFKEINL